ncbi:MAG TPA: FKBP-type peptidyl-prolyl cis-trans isomerase [Rhodanobacteraceae bacterium]|nr:FKBP-type peptidyl-prolyl cis-trans isomerase [Rhodanobacteraceae bacterium]
MRAAILLFLGVMGPVAPALASGNGPASASSTVGSGSRQATALNQHDVSYAIGYRFGSEFADGHPDVELTTLIRAIKDAYARQPPAIPMAVMSRQLDMLGRQMHRQALVEFHKLASENACKSAEFMRTNGQQPGVVTLPSGVQYKVLHKGQGAAPTADSTVVINYRGSLINGMEFDSSWAHGKPVTYAVSRMLPGWRDVLPCMHVGARWKVFIPPDQAYGEQGQLPRIGPNEALVFDIQLLDVKK